MTELVRYIVPTRGRIGRQLTVKNLPLAVRRLTTIVCPQVEVDAHRTEFPDVEVIAQPSDFMTIGEKREWIFKSIHWAHVDFVWQLDDDLKFKRCFEGQRFIKAESHHHEMETFFCETLPRLMSEYRVLGIGTSFFAPKGGVKDNYHLGFAWGADKEARQFLQMNRMDVFEDIDFTLQWLRGGYKIGVCYDVTVDQHKPDAPGGVTGERTLETIRTSLTKLISLHPGIVSEKPLKPGAHPAAITKVLWQKAAKEGGLR